MVRGTFNHVRLNNKLVVKRQPSLLPSSSPSPATTTLYLPTNTEMDIFDASEHYRNARIPLIVLAGKDYGCGPSRDWVAKGPWMLVCRTEQNGNDENFEIFLGCSSCSCRKFRSSTSFEFNWYEYFTIRISFWSNMCLIQSNWQRNLFDRIRCQQS